MTLSGLHKVNGAQKNEKEQNFALKEKNGQSKKKLKIPKFLNFF